MNNEYVNRMNYYPKQVNEEWKCWAKLLTDVKERKKNIPVLIGMNSYNAPMFTSVYCEYCMEFHTHSLSFEKGIFKPICIPDSPNRQTGYYIDVIDIPQKTFRIINDLLESIAELKNTIFELTNDAGGLK